MIMENAQDTNDSPWIVLNWNCKINCNFHDCKSILGFNYEEIMSHRTCCHEQGGSGIPNVTNDFLP